MPISRKFSSSYLHKLWSFSRRRYDCRGALTDLTKYLPKSESFDRHASLSNEEKRIEQLCDQERYRAMTTNEEEEILYQGIQIVFLKHFLLRSINRIFSL